MTVLSASSCTGTAVRRYGLEARTGFGSTIHIGQAIAKRRHERVGLGLGLGRRNHCVVGENRLRGKQGHGEGDDHQFGSDCARTVARGGRLGSWWPKLCPLLGVSRSVLRWLLVAGFSLCLPTTV